MLMVLTLNRPAPALDLTVAVRAHLGVDSAVRDVGHVALPVVLRSLLRHHGVEVVTAHRVLVDI